VAVGQGVAQLLDLHEGDTYLLIDEAQPVGVDGIDRSAEFLPPVGRGVEGFGEPVQDAVAGRSQLAECRDGLAGVTGPGQGLGEMSETVAEARPAVGGDREAVVEQVGLDGVDEALGLQRGHGPGHRATLLARIGHADRQVVDASTVGYFGDEAGAVENGVGGVERFERDGRRR
jgi:hypothetical protein